MIILDFSRIIAITQFEVILTYILQDIEGIKKSDWSA